MKTEEVKRFVSCNDFKSALRGAKEFRLGVTKEQRSKLARAYECLVFPDFYRQIGKDIDLCVAEGKSTLLDVLRRNV